MAGAGGSLRAGVTENPVRLTRSVQRLETYVTVGGAPVYVWPGGGITLMVDVTRTARQRLRLRADAGAGRADRVHPAPRRLCRARRLRGRDQAVEDVLARGGEYFNERRVRRRRAAIRGRFSPSFAGPRNERPADRLAARRPPAAPEPRADRPDRRGLRRGRRATAAYRQAAARFATILEELVAELPQLRRPFRRQPRRFRRRDGDAHGGCRLPHRRRLRHADGGGRRRRRRRGAGGHGRRPRARRAYVNDGGDIALHLGAGQR